MLSEERAPPTTVPMSSSCAAAGSSTPPRRTDGIADVVVTDGRITRRGPGHRRRPRRPARRRRWSTPPACVVTPGLIDLHAHVFPGLGDFCVEPDRAGVETGVPVVVDGGTSGVATFTLRPQLARGIRRRHAGAGVHGPLPALPGHRRLHLPQAAHRRRRAQPRPRLDARPPWPPTATWWSASRCGPPTRATTRTARSCRAPSRSRGAKPVMVHLGRFPHTPTITNEALLTTLRAGDVITHAFRAGGGQLDPGSGGGHARVRATPSSGASASTSATRAPTSATGPPAACSTPATCPHSISTDLNIYNVDEPGRLAADDHVEDLGARRRPARRRGHGDHRAGDVDPPAGRAGQPGRRPRRRGHGAAASRTARSQLSDGHESITADRQLVPVGCVRGGRWLPVDALVAGMMPGRLGRTARACGRGRASRPRAASAAAWPAPRPAHRGRDRTPDARGGRATAAAPPAAPTCRPATASPTGCGPRWPTTGTRCAPRPTCPGPSACACSAATSSSPASAGPGTASGRRHGRPLPAPVDPAVRRRGRRRLPALRLPRLGLRPDGRCVDIPSMPEGPIPGGPRSTPSRRRRARPGVGAARRVGPHRGPGVPRPRPTPR